jgi:hypothetical protein
MKKLLLIAVVILSGCANFDGQKFGEALNRSFQQQSSEQSIRETNAALALMRSGAPSKTPITNGQAFSNWANAYTSPDYEWDWDAFYNEYRQLVWACRGVQTGQFSTDDKCAFKPKTDLRWPGK